MKYKTSHETDTQNNMNGENRMGFMPTKNSTVESIKVIASYIITLSMLSMQSDYIIINQLKLIRGIYLLFLLFI